MRAKLIILFISLLCLFALTPNKVSAANYKSYGSNFYVLEDETTTSETTTSETTTSSVLGTEEVCDDTLKEFIQKYWKMIMIFSPALVILMTMIDFFKAIIASDSDAIKKAANSTFKRTLAFVFLMFLPLIIETVSSWFGIGVCF